MLPSRARASPDQCSNVKQTPATRVLCRTYPGVGGVPARQPGRQQVILLLGVNAGQVAVSALGPDLLPARRARLVPRRLQIFFG